MSDSKHNNTIVARKTDGNPEGKGQSGLLLDWKMSEPRGVVAKPRRQVLAELFTSMLVLSAKFKFRPAVGRKNFLYWKKGEWLLSLIGPEEWSDEWRAGFVGTCVLQRDMTWTVTPSERLASNNPLSAALSKFYDAFARTLDTAHTLEEVLPFHVGGLPYYQRLYASALSRSLRATALLCDQASNNHRQTTTLDGDLKRSTPQAYLAV